MKTVFIINPNAGDKNFRKLFAEIKQYVKTNPTLDFEIHLTQYANHACEIAQSYQSEEVLLVACGGDGTLNEVLNGMSEKHVLANLPMGSGNDFLKSLAIDSHISHVDYIHQLLNGENILIDYGCANNKRFINSCNFGLDADVLIGYEKLRAKNLNRELTYIIAALREIATRKERPFKIVMDDNPASVMNILFMAIMNGQYYGGSFHPTPNALLDDGLFDYMSIGNYPLWRILPLLMKYQKGTHIFEKEPIIGQFSRAIIESETPFVYGLDGEIHQACKLVIDIKHKALSFRVVKGK